MTLIFIESLEDKLRYFRSMAFDNPAMLAFLGDHTIVNIPHIDEKCVIFSLEGEEDTSLKYVVHPKTYTRIDSFHQNVNLRGLKNQMFVQDIEGVQKLSSPDFYEGIIGLLGKFSYLPGNNLKFPPKIFSQEPERVKDHFQKLDQMLAQIHARKIIHNDVKPGNIVYSKESLHLIDFSTSVNFTEYFLDRTNPEASRRNIFGTPGFLYLGVDRSKDYFALGVSFVKTLFPQLDLSRLNIQNIGRLDIYGFEFDMGRELTKRYNYSFTEYFNDLMHRKAEVNLDHVVEKFVFSHSESGVKVGYTFDVGNTTFVNDVASASVSLGSY